MFWSAPNKPLVLTIRAASLRSAARPAAQRQPLGGREARYVTAHEDEAVADANC